MDTKSFTEKYYIDRSKGNNIKWKRGRKENCLPFWIADMDFKDDEKVLKKLQEFIEKGDFGYTNLPDDYYDVLNDWMSRRHGITYKAEWIRFSSGAINAIVQVVNALSEPGDHIMINTPLYPPFKESIERCGRKVVVSRLINTDNYFTFDYADIEKKFKKQQVKMLMLCSPHNPVGRVYKKGELEELFELCRRYNVLICADEVHSDLIMPDQQFYPTLSFKKYQKQMIVITAAAKSFSLAVFSHCHIIIPDDRLRKKLITYQQINGCGSPNAFNGLPTYYNYLYGENWLDDVIAVIFENYHYFYKELSPYLGITPLEGSYLIFVDFSRLNFDGSAFNLLKDKCHLLVNAGEPFDPQYEKWVRFNLATSIKNIRKAVKAIKALLADME